jgi:phosphatidate cytidylyltransferase
MPSGDLVRRIISALALAALALVSAIAGGALFVLFWALAALVVYWEWSAIVAPGAVVVTAAGILALTLAAFAAWAGQFSATIAVLVAGAAAAALAATGRPRVWAGAGVLYAGVALLAPAVLRRDTTRGLVAILFLFAVVWATDTLGYFVGRALDGPKLAPRVSPNKTWSGAAGGACGAVLAGIGVMRAAGVDALVGIAAVALILSIVAQGGDLFESFVKRRFGVKDSSRVIPGHGGLMDRLDGFIVAAGVAALVGLLRGGIDASARGLLMW